MSTVKATDLLAITRPSGGDAGTYKVAVSDLPTSKVSTVATPPTGAQPGDLWWNSDDADGRLYVYYGGAWVDASPDSQPTAYWSRTGTTLSPGVANDSVDLGTGNLNAAAGTFSGVISNPAVTLDPGTTVSPLVRDAQGRLLVGTSTASTATSASTARIQIVGHTASTQAPGRLVLRRNETSSNISLNEQIGQIYFGDNEAGEYALIECISEGTAGAGDYPGRLAFSTTSDGTSSPTEAVRINNLRGLFTYTNQDPGFMISTARAAGSGDRAMQIKYGATAINTGTLSFQIYANGNVQNTNNSYGSISDLKLKENIVDANSQWDDLKALQVRNYNFKEGQTHTQLGLIAQEVELVSPGLVSETPDRDEDGNDLGTVTKSVNYSVLYMKAVKALQEAMERIETLEAEVQALKGAH